MQVGSIRLLTFPNSRPGDRVSSVDPAVGSVSLERSYDYAGCVGVLSKHPDDWPRMNFGFRSFRIRSRSHMRVRADPRSATSCGARSVVAAGLRPRCHQSPVAHFFGRPGAVRCAWPGPKPVISIGISVLCQRLARHVRAKRLRAVTLGVDCESRSQRPKRPVGAGSLPFSCIPCCCRS